MRSRRLTEVRYKGIHADARIAPVLTLFLFVFLFMGGRAQAQLTPTDDSFVKAGNNINNGTGQALNVIQAAQPTSTFVRFSLASLPSGATDALVAKATLRLFVTAVGSAGTFDVYRVAGAWTEAAITGNNQPLLGTLLASGVAVGASAKDGFLEVDVTPVLKEWLNGTLPNNGIALIPNGTPINVTFVSKENTSPSHESELVVELNGPAGPQGPQGPIGFPGVNGVAGPAGPQGPQGNTGAAGPIGPAGPAGSIGPVGPAGGIGSAGPAGPQGVAGNNGTNGSSINWQGTWNNVTLYSLNDAVEYNGSAYIYVNPGAGANVVPISFSNPPIWNLLARGVNWLGAWNANTFYYVNDLVSYNGSTYISLQWNSQGLRPDISPAAWSLLASAGAPGSIGPSGPSGPIGPTGAASTVPGPAGPAGPTGATGPTGPAGAPGVAGPKGANLPSAQQIGMLRWYEANQTGITVPVGSGHGIAFDGSNVWVTQYSDPGSVTKVRTNDGAVLGTYTTGSGSRGVAYDGANVWIANQNDGTVTKLRASDGSLLLSVALPTGSRPIWLAFDGINIWVTQYANASNIGYKIRPSDGSIVATFNTPGSEAMMAFDGTNMWVSGILNTEVYKIRASDMQVVGIFQVPQGPQGIAYDGTNIWVASLYAGGTNNVTELRASDGALVGTFTATGGRYPEAVTFDGLAIWITNQDGGIGKLRVSDGALLGTFNFGGVSWGAAFDGGHMWITSLAYGLGKF